MTIALNESLLAATRRNRSFPELTLQERIAVNLFWRRGVKVRIIAKAFGNRHKNTLYYQCLTGDSRSYPKAKAGTNSGIEVNEIVSKIGMAAAWKKYVTDDMVANLNAAMAEEPRKRKGRRAL